MSRQRSYPSIVDVAEQAGVSPSTVSRAFARPGRVNERTAQRIFAVAQRLGYSNQQVKVYEPQARHHLILMMVSDIGNPFFAQLIRSVQHACMNSGFGLLIADTDEAGDLERENLRKEFSHVDGLLLSSSRLSDAMIRKLAQNRQVVVLNRQVRGVSCVVPDHTPGITGAVTRLKELSHRSITYLAGPEASWADGMRWRTLLHVCREEGIALRRLRGFVPTFEGGYEAFAAFEAHPTGAVVAYNDMQALGFMSAAKDHDVDVPARISVIGIDDISEDVLVSPTLSSIHVDRKQTGTMAVHMLLSQLNGRSQPGGAVMRMMPTSFRERGSIAVACA